jgi:two-component system NarL family response regulator
MQTHFGYESRRTTRPGISMKKIRVLIVDEHVAVRQALATRLSAYAHIEVVATARSFQEGLERTRAFHPDVILLEIKGASSLQPDPVGEMSKVFGDHPAGIIVLTSYADEREREAALQAGARRYLLKHIDSSRLLSEIEAVAAEIAD